MEIGIKILIELNIAPSSMDYLQGFYKIILLLGVPPFLNYKLLLILQGSYHLPDYSKLSQTIPK